MIITMNAIASTSRRGALLSGAATLAALVMLAPSASAIVPNDEGHIVIGDPWTGPARTLHVEVNTGCSEVDAVPTLQVTTRDEAWEDHLQSTFQLSSDIPFVRTQAEVYWYNQDTDEHGSGVAHGINGNIPGNDSWEISPGLTDVEVYITQSPGVPVEFGPVRSHMASGAFAVTVIGC